MQKKSAIIIAPAFPLRGGIASSSERLAYELQKCGYDVIVYTFSLQYPNFLFPGKTQYSEDPAPEGLEIKIAINSVNPFNWREIGHELKNLKADLIITRFWLPFMGPSLGTILRIVRKNKHTKIVAIVDNIIPHEKRIGDKTLASYFVKAVDAFIVMSKSVKEEIRQFTSKSVKYIPHPIYDNYGEIVSRTEALDFLKFEKQDKYILFFGFIRDYKGLDLLLYAMADDRIRKLGIKLIVAGEYYSNQSFYENIIKAEGIKDQVILRTDFIPNEEVRYYFCGADLLVQPYKSATQSGISQLAYFFEKPMLATNVGGLPEIIDHGNSGYIVEVNSIAIAESIVDFFENNKSEAFIQQVKIRKKQYSWINLVNGIEEIVGLSKTNVK